MDEGADPSRGQHEVTREVAASVGNCPREGCGRGLTRVHDATGIDGEGRVGPLWTCKAHRTELWMSGTDGPVPPLEWWPD